MRSTFRSSRRWLQVPSNAPINCFRSFIAIRRFAWSASRPACNTPSGVSSRRWSLPTRWQATSTLSTTIHAAFRGSELLVATLAFSLQIYCDFSGYSEIALGVARMMGYELRVNFAQPYFSRSIAEFWHRWHISLSTWFRDYLYIPLGGNRVAVPRFYLNLMITFMVSGLWHGASWTFVAWGALHGLFLVGSRATAGPRARLNGLLKLDRAPVLQAALQRLLTFALVTLAWIVFRAKSIGAAAYIVTHLFPLGKFEDMTLVTAGLARANMPFIALSILVLFVAEWWIMNPDRAPRFWFSAPVRWCLFQAGVYAIVFFGVFGHIDFIYFQF